MNTVDVELPRSVVEKARELTGERSARAAITALVRHSTGNRPNARTARALRSKKRGKVFTSGKAAVAHLQEARHAQGYARKPVGKGEFDVWEKEQDWGSR